MTFHYGKKSSQRLDQCCPELRLIFKKALEISDQDISILCGHRDEADQTAAFNAGKYQLKFPESKHNSLPSRAVDAVPYPVDWHNEADFVALAETVFKAAELLGLPIYGPDSPHGLRWGGDWDGDGSRTDQNFDDLPHFEWVM